MEKLDKAEWDLMVQQHGRIQAKTDPGSEDIHVAIQGDAEACLFLALALFCQVCEEFGIDRKFVIEGLMAELLRDESTGGDEDA